MSLSSFLEQLESEREWRESEIRFLNNSQMSLDAEDSKRMRRSILCILYAHIEGFVKFSFSLYIEEINKKNLTCKDVKPAIAAAAFHHEFKALKVGDKKSTIFKSKLPNDNKLHSLAREIEFIENISNFYDYIVKIPDAYVNTESNVGQEIVQKLLFQVGLPHNELEHIYAPLNRLLNVRNDIAHGLRRIGIDDKDYEEFLNCAKTVMSSIAHILTTAYGKNRFLNTP